jgi:hypothetical protein
MKTMTEEVKVTGGCMCGAIRYESLEPIIKAGTCHCRTCQRFTGSAFSAFVGIPCSALRFTKGKPKFHVMDSIKERGFCDECGSSITDRYLVHLSGVSNPENYWIQLGTLDHPETVELDFHYGVETQLPWVHFDDELPRTRCDEDSTLAAAFASVKNPSD